jgi:predicted nucleotidyltransferase
MAGTDISPEQLAIYRRSAERLREEDRPAERIRREEAWRLARIAAALLKERFHAERVVAFGSLVAEERSFTPWSDVDIAAWGIAPADTFRAIGAVMDLSSNPPVSLVDVNTCKPSLLAVIERDGVEL